MYCLLSGLWCTLLSSRMAAIITSIVESIYFSYFLTNHREFSTLCAVLYIKRTFSLHKLPAFSSPKIAVTIRQLLSFYIYSLLRDCDFKVGRHLAPQQSINFQVNLSQHFFSLPISGRCGFIWECWPILLVVVLPKSKSIAPEHLAIEILNLFHASFLGRTCPWLI